MLPNASRTSSRRSPAITLPARRRSPRPATGSLRGILLLLLPLFLAPLSACSWISPRATRSTELTSVRSGDVLRLEPQFQAYVAADANTVDFYLSDLPAQAFADDADLSQFSGSLVHVHMFLAPRAGSTPIAFTASTATVRQVIFSAGQVGMYSGGGFLLPSGKAGDDVFGGTLRDASLRLTARSPGFVDRLGPADFASSLRVPRDVARARRMAMLMQRAQDLMPIVTKPKILGVDQGQAQRTEDQGPETPASAIPDLEQRPRENPEQDTPPTPDPTSTPTTTPTSTPSSTPAPDAAPR